MITNVTIKKMMHEYMCRHQLTCKKKKSNKFKKKAKHIIEQNVICFQIKIIQICGINFASILICIGAVGAPIL